MSLRYHLSAAGSILDQLERDMIPHPELGKAQAELARGWIYYGIRLFEASKALESTKRCNFVFGDHIPSKLYLIYRMVSLIIFFLFCYRS